MGRIKEWCPGRGVGHGSSKRSEDMLSRQKKKAMTGGTGFTGVIHDSSPLVYPELFQS